MAGFIWLCEAEAFVFSMVEDLCNGKEGYLGSLVPSGSTILDSNSFFKVASHCHFNSGSYRGVMVPSISDAKFFLAYRR